MSPRRPPPHPRSGDGRPASDINSALGELEVCIVHLGDGSALTVSERFNPFCTNSDSLLQQLARQAMLAGIAPVDTTPAPTPLRLIPCRVFDPKVWQPVSVRSVLRSNRPGLQVAFRPLRYKLCYSAPAGTEVCHGCYLKGIRYPRRGQAP